ncbi:MAG: hypothetical protein ABF743_10040 [Schleiferilactobacillus perolens]|jgi:hypothetical protein|uniref:hypothetical protein n=1 Tax=Schleiferilactobacillus perolens TaxID=100468 RepID=UPI0039E7AD32|nr:hypothetical protein [Schleiferilactobacillus harbinensis]MCI1911795.1 hypothetical protein [Schleiferilactobacillus harbinensis]
MVKKKTIKKLLKQQNQRTEYFYIQFSDGRTLEVPVQVSSSNTAAHDDLVDRIAHKTGTMTGQNGQVFDFKKIIHYDVEDTRRAGFGQ